MGMFDNLNALKDALPDSVKAQANKLGQQVMNGASNAVTSGDTTVITANQPSNSPVVPAAEKLAGVSAPDGKLDSQELANLRNQINGQTKIETQPDGSKIGSNPYNGHVVFTTDGKDKKPNGMYVDDTGVALMKQDAGVEMSAMDRARAEAARHGMSGKLDCQAIGGQDTNFANTCSAPKPQGKESQAR